MNEANPIIIGGSPSSGSTLLLHILNRHSEILAGPELSLFNKEAFYNMPYYKLKKKSKKIAKKGVCTNGWFLSPQINYKGYGYSTIEIINLIRKNNNHRDFIDNFFNHRLRKSNKSIWVEKTPSNAYCFKKFLELYPNAKVIHIYRDGRDVITSLKKRGMNSYFATMLWLYNTSSALKLRGHQNYREIKYENLVINPEETIMKLFDFLGMKYEPHLLKSTIQSKKNMINSWNHSPESSIKNDSVGKYKKGLSRFDVFIFLKSGISLKHARKNNLKFLNTTELQSILGYGVTKIKFSLYEITYFYIKMIYLFCKDWYFRLQTTLKIDEKIYSYPGKIYHPFQRKEQANASTETEINHY